MKNSSCFLACVSVLLFAPASLVAQNSGVISGIVTDSTQAVVPNAPVTIVNADTAVTVWRGGTNEGSVAKTR